LEATSLHVHAIAPHFLGNLLVAFLRDECATVSTELRREKFSIRAEVLRDGALVLTKLRLYVAADACPAPSDCKCVVEAQRRRGDPVAFMGFFYELVAYIRSRCPAGIVEGPAVGLAVAPAVLDDAALPGPDDFGPLLGMATAAGGSELPLPVRADLAAGVARAARAEPAAIAFRRMEVCVALAALLRAGSEPEVLLPVSEAARLLSLRSLPVPLPTAARAATAA